MKSEEDMDALARKLLLDDAVAPPEAVWTRLEAQLPASGSRGWAMAYFRIATGAALLLMLGFSAMYFWPTPGEPVQGDSRNLSQMPLVTSDSLRADANIEKESQQAKAQALTDSSAFDLAASDPSSARSLSSPAEAEGKQTASAYALIQKSIAVLAQTPESEAIKSQDEHSEAQAFSAAVQTTERSAGKSGAFDDSLEGSAVRKNQSDIHSVTSYNASSTFAEAPYLMQPIAPVPPINQPSWNPVRGEHEYGPAPRAGWVLGAFADVRSTSLKINRGHDGSSGLVDSLARAESASANLGAGLVFGYQLSPKWRISSGIAFAKWCRTTRYPVSFSVSEATEFVPTSDGQGIQLEQSLASATGPQNVQVNVPVTTLQGITSNFPGQAFYSQQIAVEECYQLLQLPLIVEYQYHAGRLSLLPGVGLAYDHALKRSSQLLAEGDAPLTGTVAPAEDHRRHFISFMASLHAEYMVTTHLSLRAGANYKEWITPLYQSDMVSTYPRLISIDAGIVYSFNRRRL